MGRKVAARTTADAVRDEQIRTLFSHSSPVLFANVSIAFVVASALWPTHAPLPLLIWLAGVIAVAVARFALQRRFQAASPTASEKLGAWGTRFVVGAFASGALWGLSVLAFFGAAGDVARLLLTLTLAGLAAGAAGTLSCYLPAFWSFIVPALAPLLIRNLLAGGSLQVTLATMIGVFGMALSVVALNTHRAIAEAFRLRFENEALLQRLSQAQRSLEDTNRDLEQRVVERTVALERQGQTLREAQQLEAVGRLAGGVAHDFNNLLTVILANVTLILKGPGLAASLSATLEEVQDAAERGAELVRQLLAFGRRQRLEPRVLDLNQVVGTLERLLMRLLGDRVGIAVTPSPGRALVRADRGQLEQVIINLVTNARDAMPQGGTLTIATAVVDAEGDALLPAGPYAVLSVSDTGTGMDSETRRRVFEPFFTTKELGKGTGLGLATVYGVVEQSGGHVVVESEPGTGSVFKVYLPRSLEREAVPEASALPLSAETACGTLLLAEDNAQVRAAMERVLVRAGYRVMAASSGEEALAQAEAHAGPIDVLITDVVMTKMGGAELARRLCGERPSLRVLFVSGYNQEDSLPVGGAGLHFAYLQKPVTFEVLERKVAALLAMPAAMDPAASVGAAGVGNRSRMSPPEGDDPARSERAATRSRAVIG